MHWRERSQLNRVFKGTVQPKIDILSTFNQPRVIPNLYDSIMFKLLVMGLLWHEDDEFLFFWVYCPFNDEWPLNKLLLAFEGQPSVSIMLCTEWLNLFSWRSFSIYVCFALCVMFSSSFSSSSSTVHQIRGSVSLQTLEVISRRRHNHYLHTNTERESVFMLE